MAAIKVPILAQLLADFAEVQIIATDASRKFLGAELLSTLNLHVKGEFLVDSFSFR